MERRAAARGACERRESRESESVRVERVSRVCKKGIEEHVREETEEKEEKVREKETRERTCLARCDSVRTRSATAAHAAHPRANCSRAGTSSCEIAYVREGEGR